MTRIPNQPLMIRRMYLEGTHTRTISLRDAAVSADIVPGENVSLIGWGDGCAMLDKQITDDLLDNVIDVIVDVFDLPADVVEVLGRPKMRKSGQTYVVTMTPYQDDIGLHCAPDYPSGGDYAYVDGTSGVILVVPVTHGEVKFREAMYRLSELDVMGMARKSI